MKNPVVFMISIFFSMLIGAAAFGRGATSIGQPAPGFKLESLEGKATYALDDFKGSVVMITLWATWCGVCKKQIPEMIKLQRELGPSGLKIVAINIDEKPDPARKFLKTVEEKYGPINFVSLFDKWKIMDDHFGTNSYPANFIVDRNGILVYVINGGISYSWTSSMLGRVLAGKPPVPGQGADSRQEETRPSAGTGRKMEIDASRVLISGGTLDRSAIAAVLTMYSSKVLACWQVQRASLRPGRGEVLARFVIGDGGGVETAAIEQSYIDNEKVEGCIKGVLQKMVFPSPKGGPATIRYPFVFE